VGGLKLKDSRPRSDELVPNEVFVSALGDFRGSLTVVERDANLGGHEMRVCEGRREFEVKDD